MKEIRARSPKRPRRAGYAATKASLRGSPHVPSDLLRQGQKAARPPWQDEGVVENNVTRTRFTTLLGLSPFVFALFRCAHLKESDPIYFP